MSYYTDDHRSAAADLVAAERDEQRAGAAAVEPADPPTRGELARQDYPDEWDLSPRDDQGRLIMSAHARQRLQDYYGSSIR